MLSSAEIESYNAALEKCAGDKTAAAAALNIPAKQFKVNLYNCQTLRERWSKKRVSAPPSEARVANRTALIPAAAKPVEVIQTPESIEAAAAAADTALAAGVGRIPPAILTKDEQELACSLHSFQIRHSAAAAEVIHGSVSVTAIKITKTLNDLVEEYAELTKDGRGPRNEAGGEKNEASLILEAIPKFAAELRKLSEVVGKANVAKTLIALKAKQDAAPAKRGKPGFNPLVAVNVQPGGTVKLGGPNGQK